MAATDMDLINALLYCKCKQLLYSGKKEGALAMIRANRLDWEMHRSNGSFYFLLHLCTPEEDLKKGKDSYLYKSLELGNYEAHVKWYLNQSNMGHLFPASQIE
jgi:hypothetical protein